MNNKQIIETALKGGLELKSKNGTIIDYQIDPSDKLKDWRFILEYELLSPQFWKSFSKGMGDTGYICKNCKSWNFKNNSIGYSECCDRWTEGFYEPWEWRRLKLFECLDKGSTVESYFENI